MDLNSKKPVIKYPCEWEYKIICKNKDELEHTIKGILKEKTHQLTPSKKSSKGNYHSFNLKTKVENEKERNDIYTALGKHQDIHMVL